MTTDVPTLERQLRQARVEIARLQHIADDLEAEAGCLRAELEAANRVVEAAREFRDRLGPDPGFGSTEVFEDMCNALAALDAVGEPEQP